MKGNSQISLSNHNPPNMTKNLIRKSLLAKSKILPTNDFGGGSVDGSVTNGSCKASNDEAGKEEEDVPFSTSAVSTVESGTYCACCGATAVGSFVDALAQIHSVKDPVAEAV